MSFEPQEITLDYLLPRHEDQLAIVETLKRLGFSHASLLAVNDRAHYFFSVSEGELATVGGAHAAHVLTAVLPGRKAEAIAYWDDRAIPLY